MTDDSDQPALEYQVMMTLAWVCPHHIPVPLVHHLGEPAPLAGALGNLLAGGWLTADPVTAEATLTVSMDPQLQQRLREGPWGGPWGDPSGADGRREVGRGRGSAALGLHNALRAADGQDHLVSLLVDPLSAWLSHTSIEDDTPESLDAITTMTVHLLDHDRAEEALPLARRAVAASVRHLGERHPTTLSCRSNLAVAYSEGSQRRLGIRMLETVITDREALLGSDHPSVWTARILLGGIYLDAERYEDATALVQDIHAHQGRAKGAFHRDTLQSRKNLATIHDRARRRADAIAIWAPLLRDMEQHLGSDDGLTAQVRHDLARARSLAEKTHPDTNVGALSAGAQRYADDGQAGSPVGVSAHVRLALALLDEDRSLESVSVLRFAIDTGARTLGSCDPYVIWARIRLGMVHLYRGEPDIALDLAESALHDADSALGRTHSLTLQTVELVWLLYADTDRPEEAQRLASDRQQDLTAELGYTDPLVRALAARTALRHLGVAGPPESS